MGSGPSSRRDPGRGQQGLRARREGVPPPGRGLGGGAGLLRSPRLRQGNRALAQARPLRRGAPESTPQGGTRRGAALPDGESPPHRAGRDRQGQIDLSRESRWAVALAGALVLAAGFLSPPLVPLGIDEVTAYPALGCGGYPLSRQQPLSRHG